MPGDDPELVVRYATTFHEELPDVGELETEERGILLCTGLLSRLRCARIPEHVRDVCADLDRTREATAEVRLPGDRTIVIEATGEHPRVMTGVRPIDAIFTGDPASER